MAKVIVTSLPTQGHFAPMAAIAADLTARGHEVLFYTGRLFADRAAATGARFEPFPAEIDYTERAPRSPPPEHEQLPPAEQMAYVLKHFFLDSAPYHDKRLRELLAVFPATTVIGELSNVGTLPMALRAPRGRRPTLVQIGIAPPTFESVDTAPFGPGLPPPVTPEEREDYAQMRGGTRAALADVQRHAEDVFASMGVALPDFLFNAWCTIPDHMLQLSVPGFEYPRSDAPEGFRLIGALPPRGARDYPLPQWWAELSSARRVVVVTQGTVANEDLSQLVVPTIRAMADSDALVIAATARPDGPDLVRAALDGHVPGNVRLAGFVPFESLLPLAHVLVTNAGYGGVQSALGQGVPLVVAGETEDKPEVAARVAWSGTGVDLRTARPQQAALRAAVDRVTHEASFRERAEAIRKEMARYDPFEAVAQIVAEDERTSPR
jgi:UDP:flavonoid glycosyltransferase YjiC (YdhE family)